MTEKLALNGGRRAIDQMILNQIPAWPPVYGETAEALKQIYLSRQWSFNGSYEQQFSRMFAASHS